MFMYNPLIWGYMGKKVNVYLDDKTLELWNKIPSGERSAVIKRAIQDQAAILGEDQRVVKLQRLKMEKANLEIEMRDIAQQTSDIQDSIDVLIRDFVQDDFNEYDEFEILKEYAGYLHDDQTVASYSGKSHYLVTGIAANYISIENKNSGKSSKITREEFGQAVLTVIANGGKIPQHSFIPYKMKEYVAVALHPRLVPRDGVIEWLDSFTVPITSSMVPENQGTKPPKKWISDKQHLAVFIDGKRAHISRGDRDKVAVFMMDDHPLIGKGGADEPLWTKYWMINHPGQFFWGHNGYIHSIINHPQFESGPM